MLASHVFQLVTFFLRLKYAEILRCAQLAKNAFSLPVNIVV